MLNLLMTEHFISLEPRLSIFLLPCRREGLYWKSSTSFTGKPDQEGNNTFVCISQSLQSMSPLPAFMADVTT